MYTKNARGRIGLRAQFQFSANRSAVRIRMVLRTLLCSTRRAAKFRLRLWLHAELRSTRSNELCLNRKFRAIPAVFLGRYRASSASRMSDSGSRDLPALLMAIPQLAVTGTLQSV